MSESANHIEAKEAGFSALWLKVAAIVGMTADHTAILYAGLLPQGLVYAMYAVGGVTFPVMAWLLIEGYKHTHSFKRYLARLLIFAVIAQFPFSLFTGYAGLGTSELNVLFTLALCLAIFYAYDHVKSRVAFWLLFVAATAASTLCDWAIMGPVLAILFYTQKKPHLGLLVVGLAGALPGLLVCLVNNFPASGVETMLYFMVGFTIAFLLITHYNGKRGPGGKFHKWFFYVYYPLHLLLLALGIGIIFADFTL